MAVPSEQPAAPDPAPPLLPPRPTDGDEKQPAAADVATTTPAPPTTTTTTNAPAPKPDVTTATPAEKPPPSEAPVPAAAAPAPVKPPSKPPSVITNTSTTDVDPVALDFEGTIDSNNDLPSAATLARIGNFLVLDRDGKSHAFKTLYTGKHVARRVLIIFVRHFFCGNCQEYLRSVSSSITPDSLLRLPISTFIAVVGCGDPGLIDMYAAETGCPFPIYADPTRKLYEELGMMRTLAMGTRPAYTKQHLIKSSLASVVQGLKQIKSGLATKGGDARQIGGEFLFEPLDLQSPVGTPFGLSGESGEGMFGSLGTSDTSLDGKGGVVDDGAGREEQKKVTWCHRMRTTRDHAEVPELMEVLGLDGNGVPIADQKRWIKAVESRKGTGLSMASQMSAMKGDAEPVGAVSS
ncbi:AhpC/TSA antioxidant enzyme-domain-containing protein [Podospora aff. communis PSN243]|uniref:AhpC/TSA antioxidant enzyme-domain-containing protein n=1 Tax=Podospora aff. communis PSN243 TaxID=3040156 RepID=A0AAV9H173_9PEZI|nr:AhpC/TSA antioxidant enzyme-domain-containing protein [Podospora aff. communis PSN243]